MSSGAKQSHWITWLLYVSCGPHLQKKLSVPKANGLRQIYYIWTYCFGCCNQYNLINSSLVSSFPCLTKKWDPQAREMLKSVSACFPGMRTQIRIPSTHIKTMAWWKYICTPGVEMKMAELFDQSFYLSDAHWLWKETLSQTLRWKAIPQDT